MKNLKLMSLMLLACGLILTSCGDDDDDPVAAPVPQGPSSFVASPDTIVALLGESVMIDYSATATTTLTALYVDESFANVNDTIDLSGLTSVDSVYTYTVPTDVAVGSVYSILMTMGDADGGSATAIVFIQVEGTPLPAEINGTLWHRWGANAGAWDLINDVELFMGDDDAMKDMENSDNAGEVFTGGFSALSNTLFFDITPTDPDFWNNANTTEIVVEECENAVGQNSISNPEVGDIIIAQLRDSTHAVILITSVNPAAGSGTNTGLMEFVYKKPN